MTEFKLAFRNLKRDINIYILLIVSTVIFIALIIGFQSTITSGDLGAMLSADNLTPKRMFFKIILWMIACGQYLLLFFFFNSYYRFINKIRVRELALYKVIGYSRFSIFKTIVLEGLYIYFIISFFSIICAFVINKIIITYINYNLELTTKLNASLSFMTIIITLSIFLILVLINIIRTYYKAVKVDIDIAINEEAVQKKVIQSSKMYIIIMFILGIILLVNMTFLSMQVTFFIRYGIIIIALFYAIGLFFIISALAQGYKYLVPKKYTQKKFNLLLISEVNFHLNKSKLIILSSIIFMMLSIGALVLSQVIVDVGSKTFGEYDYLIMPQIMDYTLEDGEWILPDKVSDKENYSYISIKSVEENELAKYNMNNKENIILIDKEVANESNFTNNDIVKYKIGDSTINFKVRLEEENMMSHVQALMPVENVLKVPEFAQYKKSYSIYNYLNEQVDSANLARAEVTTYYFGYHNNFYTLTTLEQYNSYLEALQEEPIELEDNQIWLDGFWALDYKDYEVKGQSYTGINSIVVSNQMVQKLEKSDDIDFTQDNFRIYYKATNEEIKKQIDQKLLPYADNSGVLIQAADKEAALGSKVFVLLMAFYIAIIFIISNFVLLAINLLSHAIENKKLYAKLKEMGQSSNDCSQYVSKFIRRFYIIPLTIGVISGLVVTNFAVSLLFMGTITLATVDTNLIIYIMALYIISYMLFISITKYIYIRIINN